ncbi:E3 ubiquitin-protein ligase RNF169-like [Leptopilina heterotoma]|uniref:E3 ubiquitin-protein ligase RNF169-like n=1 Tax=Leptopilina heterotoma TaxID=63436 RepID=UPI001CA923D2|nr:E3 ubiquitin-protein ligase RNF169-like [Leptopilina heterotoma]
MATCLKRTSKLFDPSLCRSSSYANLRDLLCPVCRAILIEPVTLPCEHNLCLSCLNGTIQHNNLNCPLCRTRVGSWLRTNSKSNTLVNIRLWEIIRTKFPKEVECRRNGEDTDIDLDPGYAARTKILSAAGEIRKEYETQLQLEEEEKRRKQQAEAIASEALIRKIQAEEQQQLAQLAQDELLAKTLAKKEIRTKFDTKMKTEPVSKTVQKTKNQDTFDCDEPIITKFKSVMHPQKTNIALISKIRAESYASSIKSTGLNQCKDSSEKMGSYKNLPVQDTVTRLFKNQVITKFIQPSSYNFNLEPSCSKIYGLQSKEELHVPNDVLNSKKKNVEVEICVTTVTDDSRIGSAESAGSHDSINQEIHHFKPIKAMPRTALRTTRDGRQIDTKLVRVVPILKRVTNLVPKSPSLTRFKRIPSCSWSAFKGKIKDSKSSSVLSKIENLESTIKPVAAPVQIVTISGTLVKPQVSEIIDVTSEMSFDTNKNIKKIINGTKISKKLNLEESNSCDKVKKIYDSPVKNGTLRKNKRQKNKCNDSDDSYSDSDIIDSQSINSSKSDISVASTETQKEVSIEEIPIENIAERIKKRKINIEKRYNNNTDDFVRRSLRKRSTAVKYITGSSESLDEFSDDEEELPKQKRPRKGAPKLMKESEIVKNSSSKVRNQPPELTRELPVSNKRKGRRRKTKSPIEEEEEVESDDLKTSLDDSAEKAEKASDDEIIDEQKRIELLLRQEQEDREMAERLQAQFNEWENMAGRTRNSRRALEIGSDNPENPDVGLGKRERRTANSHINKQLNQTTSSRSQRKRPQPRALK